MKNPIEIDAAAFEANLRFVGDALPADNLAGFRVLLQGKILALRDRRIQAVAVEKRLNSDYRSDGFLTVGESEQQFQIRTGREQAENYAFELAYLEDLVDDFRMYGEIFPPMFGHASIGMAEDLVALLALSDTVIAEFDIWVKNKPTHSTFESHQFTRPYEAQLVNDADLFDEITHIQNQISRLRQPIEVGLRLLDASHADQPKLEAPNVEHLLLAVAKKIHGFYAFRISLARKNRGEAPQRLAATVKPFRILKRTVESSALARINPSRRKPITGELKALHDELVKLRSHVIRDFSMIRDLTAAAKPTEDVTEAGLADTQRQFAKAAQIVTSSQTSRKASPGKASSQGRSWFRNNNPIISARRSQIKVGLPGEPELRQMSSLSGP